MAQYDRLYPQTVTPDGTDVEEGFSNDDNELKRIYSILSSLGALNLSDTKRQSVLYGGTDASGNPNYLTSSGLNVSIDGSSKPIILAFANGFNNDSGSVDVLDKITSAISNAYTLPPNQTCYLYVDKDINNGLLSYGYTLYPDQYLKSAPSSPVLDQHYYNTNEAKMYRYNGSAWEVKQRIFLAKAVTDASTTTLTIYPFGSRTPLFSQKINNITFDGTADITITQVNGKDIATTDQLTVSYDKAHLFAVNGYQKLDNGWLIQWGYQSTTPLSNPITFPIAFPTACFIVVGVPIYSASTYRNPASWTTTGFVPSATDVKMAWIAIGN